MKQILIVEDSRTLGSLIKKKIEEKLNISVEWVQTYEDAAYLFHKRKTNFISALLDINLPDAPDGEILDFIIPKKIPSIVFTSKFSGDFQKKIWLKGIVDYVLKDDPDNLNYIISLLKRLESNKNTKIIVADDSSFSRQLILHLLKIHNYIVYQARDGKEAMDILGNNPDVKMIISDYNMPRMDGFQLIKTVRKSYSKNSLAIIGISAQGNHKISSKLIKNGANDFIVKPFSAEEFYCRVTQNIQTIDYIQTIKEISHKDYLTNLYNRRYFFQSASEHYIASKNNNKSFSIAMLDIDYFKNINDAFGHEAGDAVLKQLSTIFQTRFLDSDIVCRFGGEEFCILKSDTDPKQSLHLFTELKNEIEQTKFKIKDERQLSVTVSVGICGVFLDSLEKMINQADKMLYQAKENGRNRVELYGQL